MRVSASHSSIRATRHLLSYPDHQESTRSHRSPSYPCATRFSLEGMKPSKSVPYIRNGIHHVYYCIRSVDTHHETSAELSRSSVVDDISLRYTIHALLKSSSLRCEQYHSQLAYLAILDTFKYWVYVFYDV